MGACLARMSQGSPCERDGGGDELGAVDHRTAADGQQEVDILVRGRVRTACIRVS